MQQFVTWSFFIQLLALWIWPLWRDLSTITRGLNNVNNDGYYIERAIENLILNALRYAKQTVKLRIEESESSICLHVEDDGPGVSDINKERIFAPFYRPDPARSRERGGAGLGLAIVKRIQHWHDGDCIVIDSELGGADFILRYPKY